MKIEMGESLFYSWLRHVKGCQLVQTNWKASHQWQLYHEGELENIKNKTDSFFKEKYGYDIYKRNASLSQILQQGECDVLGICFQGKNSKVYAVDVAFHENGLNYGSRQTTVMKVISKCIRTAMCIYGYFDNSEAEIIFASPKIHSKVLNDIIPCISEAQRITDSLGYKFRFKIIANNDFREEVLGKVLNVSENVADTSELFLRSYQMLQMFEDGSFSENDDEAEIQNEPVISNEADRFSGMKVGKIAQEILIPMLESGCASETEVLNMQTVEYSKNVFGISGFSVLVKAESDYDDKRYYKSDIKIRETNYKLCSQWHKSDRPFLIKWINEHTDGYEIFKRGIIYERFI